MENNGITLFRIKETKDHDNGEIQNTIIYAKPGANDAELALVINTLCSCITSVMNISFDIDIEIKRDRNLIYEQYIQSEKENSLAVRNPKLASQWHPTKNGCLLPEYVSVSSNKKVWWICEKEHEWQAIINSRQKGSGCPYCAGQKAILGYNDLNTVNPMLASQWHPSKNGNLSSNQLTENSNKMVWWICEKGHEWKAIVYDRKNGCNCPICSGHQILIGYNDLATVNTELALQWHPIKNGVLTPQDVTAGSGKKVWWKCKNGHEWQAVISSRNAGYGCPYCAGEKLYSWI